MLHIFMILSFALAIEPPQTTYNRSIIQLLLMKEIVSELNLTSEVVSQIREIHEKTLADVKMVNQKHRADFKNTSDHKSIIDKINKEISAINLESEEKYKLIYDNKLSQMQQQRLTQVYYWINYPRIAFMPDLTIILRISKEQLRSFERVLKDEQSQLLSKYIKEKVFDKTIEERIAWTAKAHESFVQETNQSIIKYILTQDQVKQLSDLMGRPITWNHPGADYRAIELLINLKSKPKPPIRIAEPFALYMLIQCKGIDSLIGLSAEQCKSISRMGKAQQNTVDAFYISQSSLAVEQQQSQLAAWHKKYLGMEKEFTGILRNNMSDKSFQRLVQLQLQLQGPGVLLSGANISYYNLSNDEQNMLRTKFNEELTSYNKKQPSGNQVYLYLPKDVQRRIVSVLPVEKQQLWVLIQGEEFTEELLSSLIQEYNTLEVKRRDIKK